MAQSATKKKSQQSKTGASNNKPSAKKAAVKAPDIKSVQTDAKHHKTKNPKSPQKRVLTPLGITLICVIGFLLAAFTAASVIALTYDRIYPGLHAYGIKVSGLTRDEAEAELAGKLSDVYRGKSVTLTIDGRSVDITAEEAGAALSAAGTADALYQAGRTGSTVSRLGFVFSSLFSHRTVEDHSVFYIDRDAVFNIADALSDELSQQPVEYMWTIGTDFIDVTGGREGFRSDPEAITDAVIERFKEQDYSPLIFESAAVAPAPLPLEELYSQILVEAASAYIRIDENNQAVIMPHVLGVSFDMENALGKLAQKSERFIIPLLFTMPDITADSLEESLFRDLLGEYSTSTSGSSANRINNIRLTAEYMTGAILMPGDNFSFNEVVGNRTEERGFTMAGSYLNGKIVDAIGGGVCQSSTTLYNAALLSNLQIVYRQNHSMTVAYVPLGRDAAVDWGRIDFLFSNDTPYPIRVVSWYANGRLTVQIWGTKTDDLTVSIENEIIAYRPAQTITEYNPDLAPGEKSTKQTGSDGYTVQTYRIVKDADGNVVYRNNEAKSAYMKVDIIIEVGVSPGGELPDDPIVTPPPGDPTPDPDPEPDPYPDPEPPPADNTEGDEHYDL